MPNKHKKAKGTRVWYRNRPGCWKHNWLLFLFDRVSNVEALVLSPPLLYRCCDNLHLYSMALRLNLAKWLNEPCDKESKVVFARLANELPHLVIVRLHCSLKLIS